MAEIRVEKKSGSSGWMWLIGLLVLLVAIWFVWQMFDRDDERVNTTTTPAPVTGTVLITPAPTTGTTVAPAGTTGTDTTTPAGATATGSAPAGTPTSATGAAQPGGTASGDRVTDAGVFASTGDKLSLVGREAAFTNARVVRVVGPKSFTVAAGSEELMVMVDQDLSRGVGTQGQIDQGNTISLKGKFQRLQQEEISDLSNSRFRDLTEQERETLKKTQVYLQATEFSKVS